MSELHHFEMPMSFTGRALIWGASSNILNPPNKKFDFYLEFTIGKCCRAIARLVYQVAIIVLVPFGTLYHLFMALTRGLQEWTWSNTRLKKRFSHLAVEHLRAAGLDLVYPLASFLCINPPFCFVPSKAYEFFPLTIVKAPPLLSVDEQAVQLIMRRNKPADNVSQMRKGLYQFRDLLRAALKLRERDNLSQMPSLEDREVHKLCGYPSYLGTNVILK